MQEGTHSERSLEYCIAQDLKAYIPWSQFYHGLTLAQRGETRGGRELMRMGMAGAESISMKMMQPAHLGYLAPVHARLGEAATGLDLLDRGLAIVEATEERICEAELRRIRGELLIGSGELEKAQADFESAVAIARRQNAKMWELRAANSLARLWRDHGRGTEARELLAPIYGWFTEGFDTPDLKEAAALLFELA